MTDQASDPVTRAQPTVVPSRWSLIALFLASSLTVMAGATIAPSLPQIEQVFADTPNAPLLARLVVTLPAIFIVIGAPVAGAVVDRHGRKNLLLIGLVLYALAGTSGLYLDSLYTILLGRALLGLAVACNMTAATTIIADLFSGPERAKTLGRQSAFMGGAGVLFLLIGGWLAEFSWRAPFGIYFCSLAVLAMVWFLVDEPKREAPLAGDAPKARWPVAMVAMIMAMVVIAQIAFYLWPVQLPFFLAERFDLAGTPVGLAIAVASGTTVFTSVLYRQARDRFTDLGLMAIVYVLLGIANLLLAIAPTYLMVLATLVLGGAAIGLSFPAGANWVTSVVPPELRGRAVGLASAALFCGHFLSPLASRSCRPWVTARAIKSLGSCLLGLALWLACRGF